MPRLNSSASRPDEFGDTVSVDGVLSVTSGDWDGDGERDLAIGEQLRGGIGPGSTIIDIQRRGVVHVFRDIGERLAGAPLTLNLADDDVTLQGEQDLDLFGGLADDAVPGRRPRRH